MATSPRSGPTSTAQLTFLSEARPASRSQSPALEAEWMTSAVSWPSSFSSFLIAHAPDGWCGRTSPASCRRTEDGTLAPSSEGWSNSGMGSPTESWTLSTSEFHSGAVASSLSDILETGDVPQRFYLSATACRGILRRAAKRGKHCQRNYRACSERVANGTVKAERLVVPQGYGGETAPTLNAAFGSKLGLDNQHIDSGAGLFVAHSLRAEGFDASEDGTGRGTPLVPVPRDSWCAD
jgi:hypothetical protein